MPFFATPVPMIEKANFNKIAQFQPNTQQSNISESDYTLLIDTDRMQKALNSGFVAMPSHIQKPSDIHEFLLNAGKKHGV